MSDTERRLAAVLAEHEPLPILESGPILIGYGCPAPCSWGNEGGYGLDAHRAHLAAALLPVVAEIEAEARAGALRLVREVETEMSAQAADAWRSADARRGLSDHEALLVHADALTRWSERFRMAFEGEDYRTAEEAE